MTISVFDQRLHSARASGSCLPRLHRAHQAARHLVLDLGFRLDLPFFFPFPNVPPLKLQTSLITGWMPQTCSAAHQPGGAAAAALGSKHKLMFARESFKKHRKFIPPYVYFGFTLKLRIFSDVHVRRGQVTHSAADASTELRLLRLCGCQSKPRGGNPGSGDLSSRQRSALIRAKWRRRQRRLHAQRVTAS